MKKKDISWTKGKRTIGQFWVILIYIATWIQFSLKCWLIIFFFFKSDFLFDIEVHL